ncbi:tetratricopeptide repeat protein [Pseudogemmobacter faecipullorum]|uniref:Tetratricopeptide repeat protein n=1 Tax=Pseudogemmobacter faecipullorum TaxID=2755041 RepID=A0ABS8CH89_9RHOB|nr:tetratricopeptide repeat protein [Pseudogemmobacter faecipullorum]MCB5408731.1 tetratricopeptide repeat protein [Pseudogemmobacter faecipullorum]
MPGAATKAPAETEQVAEAAWSIGDYEEAARLYELAAARDSRSVEALIGLGKSYAALGQYSRAGNALARARDLDRRNPEVYNQLGNLALLEMHPKEAIDHFSDALRLDRRNLAAFTGKGVSLDYLSRHAEAHEVYREALKFYPTNFPLLSNYALSQVLGRQIGEGTRLMEELLRDPANGETVRANLAIAYALDGRVRDARAMLTGLMSEAEINASLRHYEAARQNYLAGKPVGYMIFQ